MQSILLVFQIFLFLKVISFPAKLPKQFGLHKLIDYETQYNKSFVEPMSFILDSAKWSVDASGDNTIEEINYNED